MLRPIVPGPKVAVASLTSGRKRGRVGELEEGGRGERDETC